MSVTGAAEIEKNLLNLDAKFNGAITRTIKDVTEEVKREAVFRIHETSFGEAVTKYKDGEKYTHIVSKPGDPPNTDTGDLAASVRTKYANNKLTGFVYTGLDYGFYLETVLNRPWLQPALEAKQPLMRDLFMRRVGRAIRQAAKK